MLFAQTAYHLKDTLVCDV